MNSLYIFTPIYGLAQGIVMGKGKQAIISRCCGLHCVEVSVAWRLFFFSFLHNAVEHRTKTSVIVFCAVTLTYCMHCAKQIFIFQACFSCISFWARESCRRVLYCIGSVVRKSNRFAMPRLGILVHATNQHFFPLAEARCNDLYILSYA